MWFSIFLIHFQGNIIFTTCALFLCFRSFIQNDRSERIVQICLKKNDREEKKERLSFFSQHDLYFFSFSRSARLLYLCSSFFVSLCPLTHTHTHTPLSSFLSFSHQQRQRASPDKVFEVDSFVNRHYYCN